MGRGGHIFPLGAAKTGIPFEEAKKGAKGGATVFNLPQKSIKLVWEENGGSGEKKTAEKDEGEM